MADKERLARSDSLQTAWPIRTRSDRSSQQTVKVYQRTRPTFSRRSAQYNSKLIEPETESKSAKALKADILDSLSSLTLCETPSLSASLSSSIYLSPGYDDAALPCQPRRAGIRERLNSSLSSSVLALSPPSRNKMQRAKSAQMSLASAATTIHSEENSSQVFGVAFSPDKITLRSPKTLNGTTASRTGRRGFSLFSPPRTTRSQMSNVTPQVDLPPSFSQLLDTDLRTELESVSMYRRHMYPQSAKGLKASKSSATLLTRSAKGQITKAPSSRRATISSAINALSNFSSSVLALAPFPDTNTHADKALEQDQATQDPDLSLASSTFPAWHVRTGSGSGSLAAGLDRDLPALPQDVHVTDPAVQAKHQALERSLSDLMLAAADIFEPLPLPLRSSHRVRHAAGTPRLIPARSLNVSPTPRKSHGNGMPLRKYASAQQLYHRRFDSGSSANHEKAIRRQISLDQLLLSDNTPSRADREAGIQRESQLYSTPFQSMPTVDDHQRGSSFSGSHMSLMSFAQPARVTEPAKAHTRPTRERKPTYLSIAEESTPINTLERLQQVQTRPNSYFAHSPSNPSVWTHPGVISPSPTCRFTSEIDNARLSPFWTEDSRDNSQSKSRSHWLRLKVALLAHASTALAVVKRSVGTQTAKQDEEKRVEFSTPKRGPGLTTKTTSKNLARTMTMHPGDKEKATYNHLGDSRQSDYFRDSQGRLRKLKIAGLALIVLVVALAIVAVSLAITRGARVGAGDMPMATNVSTASLQSTQRPFYAIGYDAPGAGNFNWCNVSYAQIYRDVQQLAQFTTRLRTYSSDCGQLSMLLQAIDTSKVNLTVEAGVLMDAQESTFDRQLAAVNAAMSKYKGRHISSIIVGSNYLSTSIRSNTTSATQELVRAMTVTATEIKPFVEAFGIASIPIGTAQVAGCIDPVFGAAADFVIANLPPAASSTDVAQTYANLVKTLGSTGPSVYLGMASWPNASNATALDQFIQRNLCAPRADRMMWPIAQDAPAGLFTASFGEVDAACAVGP
ncbi:glycoside hydrolase family 17 protein [Mixia osmundae IAM 14324]|uniref:glycoside hydrolase family 17 protein n=1 Tax=Mixia osmundae (strain CBS 9802 / IAM 14324 / JCM 22182 / KY 12970) TaxID=764103 RepID=UPI0004A5542B|nr:glycoside hydrolase family 17 protein [Mixia osmundae IAM 14324]KEI38323.1 glycoside hydrolase family 17 protein [Mixia osmundae IAM 14324]